MPGSSDEETVRTAATQAGIYGIIVAGAVAVAVAGGTNHRRR
jgi:hypothetical protein